MKNEKFLEIIDSTPLVSIDLIVEGKNENYLLGKRINRPAKGYWFVPGGRIRKNETLSDAFIRISSIELGIELDYSKAVLLGAYDHIYEDNFHSRNCINTHYVALGYKVSISDDALLKIDDQHSEIKWWSKYDLLKNTNVHNNTKNYFKNT